MMTVTVKTRSGGYASGLNREVFELTDQNEVRPIEFFDNTDGPASVGILVDTSESMQGFGPKEMTGTEPIDQAIAQFLQIGHPNNEYFLATFDRTTRFLTEWQNGNSLLNETKKIGPGERDTALYDACFASIEKLQSGHFSKKVLILLSDGGDNLSRHTFNDLRDFLKKSDIILYAVGIFSRKIAGTPLAMEGAGALAELSEVTGGASFLPEDKKEMRVAMNLIATRLRNQYRIGFRAIPGDPSNKWRRLKLKVNLPADAPQEFRKLTIRMRQGYYTP